MNNNVRLTGCHQKWWKYGHHDVGEVYWFSTIHTHQMNRQMSNVKRLQKAIKSWPFFCVTFPWSISSFCHTDKHYDVHRRYASGQCKRFRHHWAFEIVNSSTLVLNAPLWAVVVACLTRCSSCSSFCTCNRGFFNALQVVEQMLHAFIRAHVLLSSPPEGVRTLHMMGTRLRALC